MEYNWDKSKIETLKKEYINLSRNTEGLLEEDLVEIKDKLSMIQEMEDIYHEKDIFSFDDCPTYVDKTEFLPESTLADFEKIPNIIKKWVRNSVYIFQNFRMAAENLNVPELNLTNEELIAMSHDFFKWLPNKKYVSLVDKYLSKEEGILRIQNNETLHYYVGSTYPFYFPYYQPFYLIERENTINDFCTLNHEIAHGIYVSSDTNLSLNNHSQYLFELEGYHFDFLSRMFLKEKNIVSSKTLKILEYYEFLSAVETSTSFYVLSLAIVLFNSQKEIRIEEVNQQLIKNLFPLQIDEDTLCEYLLEDPQDLVTYTLSFLANLDLEKLYHLDKEFSFHEFEAIRYNKTNNLEKNLTDHGITFIQDGYQNLQEKVKKLSLIKD